MEASRSLQEGLTVARATKWPDSTSTPLWRRGRVVSQVRVGTTRRRIPSLVGNRRRLLRRGRLSFFVQASPDASSHIQAVEGPAPKVFVVIPTNVSGRSAARQVQFHSSSEPPTRFRRFHRGIPMCFGRRRAARPRPGFRSVRRGRVRVRSGRSYAPEHVGFRASIWHR